MSITKERKTEVIESYRRDDQDTGSPEVQVALLTTRIKELTKHLQTHKRDFASQRGLIMMVNKRNGLLKYLRRKSPERYLQLIQSLGLRK